MGGLLIEFTLRDEDAPPKNQGFLEVHFPFEGTVQVPCVFGGGFGSYDLWVSTQASTCLRSFAEGVWMRLKEPQTGNTQPTYVRMHMCFTGMEALDAGS